MLRHRQGGARRCRRQRRRELRRPAAVESTGRGLPQTARPSVMLDGRAAGRDQNNPSRGRVTLKSAVQKMTVAG